MTGDARGEAEAIVKAVTHEAYKHGASVYGGLPADDVDRDSEGRLVAALAAAIEHVTANDDVPDDYSVGAWDMDADTFRALRDALSALRARAGEEP